MRYGDFEYVITFAKYLNFLFQVPLFEQTWRRDETRKFQFERF